MNPLPPLTDQEYGDLRKSVERDGVRGNPVLLDRSGNVIDGHNRVKVAAELGIDWPTEILDVDDETADRLRITL
ncbi:MAG TPA: ParB N-terminal domain-containing protein, partial [Acidimicrobiia bacterium]|nr:ParB N-terminal domain-containing protein [Acidimicrobiia bacterium]